MKNLRIADSPSSLPNLLDLVAPQDKEKITLANPNAPAKTYQSDNLIDDYSITDGSPNFRKTGNAGTFSPGTAPTWVICW